MAVFKNSIAQDRVQFPIQTIIRPQSGAQYSRVVIFIGADDVATYLNTALDAGKYIQVQSNTYATDTKGKLKDTLALFFSYASTGIVYVVNPLADDATLAKTYDDIKTLGFFKTVISEAGFTSMNTALGKLCSADEENSLHFVTIAEDVTGGNIPDSSLIKALTDGKIGSFVKYHPTQDIALAQIGKTISSINGTATPVGNSLDMIAMTGITASGANGANLTPTHKNNLDKLRIGYSTDVGDGTENVAIEGSLDLNGNSAGAKWVKGYITYMCKIKTAGYITQGNILNNSTSYVAICSIVRDMVTRFETIGRLTDVHFNFPSFAVGVEQGYIVGDKINIPSAWDALYVDSIREVRIYGTLYIDQPTR